MNSKKTYLITGAGTGFGKEIALRLAQTGEKVIAGVETMSEVATLILDAQEKEIDLQVEKLDITDPLDRARAGLWDVDVLLNNAGISLGGSLVDIPEVILRYQFEVNVFGTMFLTQQIAREMVKKRCGKIVFVSSVHGLVADPISGPYCGTKFALEAFAESLSYELQEFNVEVAVINPGPYLTGFNDREFEAYKLWKDDPTNRLFDYEKMAFPFVQFKNIDPVVKETIEVLKGTTKNYRNVIPNMLGIYAKKRQNDLWNKQTDKDLGKRHSLIQNAYESEPGTTLMGELANKIKSKLKRS
ncbi:MAG: SDR family oxidoreductase [Clostridiaceae bacterium]